MSPTASTGREGRDEAIEPTALERAQTDYLAVSRGRHLYASDADHAAAEARAWERLEEAVRVRGVAG
jgi:hypothetical protein